MGGPFASEKEFVAGAGDLAEVPGDEFVVVVEHGCVPTDPGPSLGRGLPAR